MASTPFLDYLEELTKLAGTMSQIGSSLAAHWSPDMLRLSDIARQGKEAIWSIHPEPLTPWATAATAAKTRLAAATTSQGQRATGTALATSADPIYRWDPIVTKAAEDHGVPKDVLYAIMMLESGGNPDAVSAQGAVGLFQVMPQYHAARAQKYGGNLRDPAVNAEVAAEILAENYHRIKSANPGLSDDQAWELAAAAYFGAFDWNTLQVTGAQDAYGTTGQAYVDKFRANRAKVRQELGQALGGRMELTTVTGGQAYPITQGYGETEFARTSGMYRDHFHHGIDVGVPQGTTITAPMAGTVVAAGDSGDGYGIKVVVKLDNGYTILLGHLSQVKVAPGQRVTPGAVLGKSGNTGASTAPHLHVQVRDPSDREVDPTTLFTW